MGSSKELGDYLVKNGLQRPLIVTDPYVSQLGFFKELVGDIKRKNISAEVFHDIHKNQSNLMCIKEPMFLITRIEIPLLYRWRRCD
jgi:alcohol dehydrogenase class IV